MKRCLLLLLVFLMSLLICDSLQAGSVMVTGSTSCSSSNCHGGTATGKDQFTTWATEDKHAKAYGVLFNQRSKTMAEVLQLKSPAPQDDFCLRCHALAVPTSEQGSKYDRQDGVTCEACHGRAEQWLEPHTRKGWSYSGSLKLGMYDNRDLAKRVENCLRCHSGIDHALLAAGHPDLVFEQDTFSAVMPKHWKEKQPWAGAKAWAVGQAASLQHSMEAMTKRMEKQGRLDETSLDEADRNCFSCHHNIYDVKWTVQPETAGRALWNTSRYAIFRHFLHQAFPEAAQDLDSAAEPIAAAFRSDQPNLQEVRRSAGQIADQMKELIPKINSFGFTPPLVQGLIQAISGDAEAYRTGGFRVAEQGLMAVDALSLAAAKVGVKNGPVLQQVKKLYDVLDLKDPARYDPKAFGAAMAKLHEMVK